MRKSIVLTIILAILFSALVAGCTPAAPPQGIPPAPEVTQSGIFLTVTQPVDGSIVNVDRVEVIGRTTPGMVVSVNEEITNVDAGGNFVVTATLEEGPNIIEVIASDEEGNEARLSLTVTLVNGG